MTDSEFHQVADDFMNRVEHAIDSNELDIDVDRSGNVMTLEFDDGGQLVLNKQEPLHELWLASKLGASHYQYRGDNKDWFDERNQITLDVVLIDMVDKLSGEALDLS
ncbi:iron donor protein CyaY [Paraferrimonas sedimenticola]|uniref:Iron-sulfur cluster assembly protein CyaY n=1 Tax=Paraferrimonas sedimenticola TaxID=375674 RepID=A0AA37RZL4_9GAMM|nr:iron donor protein CyaY [Paraferrimonas sedimenticola]GLP97477.1 protein CyaY [Paraferrimonas sedimenticola]